MVNALLAAAFALAAGFWWILLPARAMLHDRRLGMLSHQPYVEPERWPRISVLVPARNEEAGIEHAVRSLLRVDYPALEIVIVDDRSTDRTGEIIDRLAAADGRIRALHIDALPDGWLGKVHALHRGIGASSGEWLLFTDADIHFAPDVLKRAVAHCLHRERDFLALFPGFLGVGLVNGATQAAFGVLLLSMLDFARITDPDSRMAMGVGAFNLARRSFIDDEQGLEWLRMEVADDVGLGLMMKRRGARVDILSGQDLLQVDWYPSLGAMLNGVMQRFVMGANYHLGLYLLNVAAVFFCLLAPLGLALALAAQSPWAWNALAVYALPSLILGAGIKHLAIPPRLLCGLPLGFAVMGYGMLHALVTCLRHGGLYWRGTVYPLAALRAGRRVRLNAYF